MNYARFVKSKVVAYEDEHSTVWSPVLVGRK